MEIIPAQLIDGTSKTLRTHVAQLDFFYNTAHNFTTKEYQESEV